MQDFLLLLIIFAFFSCGTSVQGAGCRLGFSYARDGALPGVGVAREGQRRGSRRPSTPSSAGAVVTAAVRPPRLLLAGEDKHIGFITYPANINALVALVSFGVSGIYLSFLLTVDRGDRGAGRGWVPEGRFQLGRWAWPVLIVAAGYLGLMLAQRRRTRPASSSPRGYFNLDWITLLVMFVIAVVGVIVFLIARPDRAHCASTSTTSSSRVPRSGPDGGLRERPVRGRAHRAGVGRVLPARGNEYAGRMRNSRVFAMVLAGGEGKRLAPLTADRAKPAVPFGGNYRLIDFALSNLVNAGQLKIAVLTQYKSESLGRHIATTWRLSPLLGNYVTPVPAQMRRGPSWFAGSADAIYQNLNLIHDERPNYICVFGADHVFRMDPRQMLEQHIALGAGLTVAGIRIPIETAREFGIIETDGDSRTIGAFREKPKDPVGLADSPGEVLASMGNYIFSADVLIDAVTRDAADPTSAHDLGGNIIPELVERGQACVWDFANSKVPGRASATSATGATSGRWTPTTTRTWT